MRPRQTAALKVEVAQAKATNAAVPDAHDYDEATTRDAFIDVLLAEAGWTFTRLRHRVSRQRHAERVRPGLRRLRAVGR
jgi:type I site-specific restriction endonuclease